MHLSASILGVRTEHNSRAGCCRCSCELQPRGRVSRRRALRPVPGRAIGGESSIRRGQKKGRRVRCTSRPKYPHEPPASACGRRTLILPADHAEIPLHFRSSQCDFASAKDSADVPRLRLRPWWELPRTRHCSGNRTNGLTTIIVGRRADAHPARRTRSQKT